jgi:ankyrin repeat protein
MRHLSTDSHRIQEHQGGTRQLRRFRRPNLPFLFYAVIGRNWDSALRRINTHPDEIFSVEDISGDTVLHYACRLDPPTEIVIALIPICFEKNREGATALHVAVCYRCSADVIKAMLEGEQFTNLKTPLPLLLTNKARIPLHYACSSYRGLGLEAFRILLDATIEAQAWLDDESSKYKMEESSAMVFEHSQKMFCSEKNEMDEDRERMNAFTMQDSLGHSPLSLLFKRYRERVKYVIRYLERNRPGTSVEAAHIVQNELGGLWQKARLLVCRMLERNKDTISPCDFDRQESLCPREAAVARQAAQWAAQRYQNCEYQNHEDEDEKNERTFRLVHASVALAGYGCPIEMVRLAISVYPQQAQEMDEDGNLPLHIAAVASSYIPDNFASTSAEDSLMSGHSNLLGHSPRQPFGTVIKMLLKSYPEATKIPHGLSGRLPLILALEARQRSMADGLKSLIDAYPAALESKEFDPKLYPYILSMIGKHTVDGTKNKQLVAPRKKKAEEKTLNRTMPTALYDYLRAGPHLLLNFKQ